MTFQQITPMTPFPEDPQTVIQANERILEHLRTAMDEMRFIGNESDYIASRSVSKAIRALNLHTEALQDYAKRQRRHYFTADTDEAQACGHSWDNRKYDEAGRPICELCDLQARLAVAEDELSKVKTPPPSLSPKVQRVG